MTYTDFIVALQMLLRVTFGHETKTFTWGYQHSYINLNGFIQGGISVDHVRGTIVKLTMGIDRRHDPLEVDYTKQDPLDMEVILWFNEALGRNSEWT